MNKIIGNRTKGHQGENEVSFLLKKIFFDSGDIQDTDSAEDKGVDFSFKFISPVKNRYFSKVIEIQVKTGDSFVKKLENNWKLKIKKDEFRKFQNTNSFTIIVWVDPETSEAYWTHIKKESHVGHIFISKRSILSPITKYDFMIKFYQKQGKLNELTTDNRLLIPPLNKGIREYSKSYYKSHLLGKQISTLWGMVEITWNGWRKITRAGRKQENIQNSLILLPILKPTLEKAEVIAGFRRGKEWPKGNRIIETRYLFIESSISTPSGAKQYVKITLKEIIDYPDNWKKELCYYEKVERVLIFYSIALIKKKGGD
jgi:uncharacterized protein DUF4365